MCISQVLLLFFLVRYSWSTYKGIIHTIFCITIVYPKQQNALESSRSNAIRQKEMAYIAFPNIAWERLLETGLDDLQTCSRRFMSRPCQLMRYADLCVMPTYAPRWLIRHADLCAAPTYAPRWKPSRHNFEHLFPWPLPCTKVGVISLSKPEQSALKSHNIRQCIVRTNYNKSTSKSRQNTLHRA